MAVLPEGNEPRVDDSGLFPNVRGAAIRFSLVVADVDARAMPAMSPARLLPSNQACSTCLRTLGQRLREFTHLIHVHENVAPRIVFSGTKSGDASGRKQWLRAVQGSLGELGEAALQLLNGTLPYVPRVQVQENADEVLVSVSLPGIDQSSLDVLLEKSSLVIRGASTTEQETRRRNYRRITKLARTFDRAIPLHGEIERNGILATMHGEVLTVRLPKADAARLPAHRVAVAADAAQGKNSPAAPSRETAAV